MQIWSNESQERYVLAIPAERLDEFKAMCERERCPFAVVGLATEERQLRVLDPEHDNYPVDMPMDVLLGKPPKMHRDVEHVAQTFVPWDFTGITLEEAADSVLRLPTVADKSFRIIFIRPFYIETISDYIQRSSLLPTLVMIFFLKKTDDKISPKCY